MPKDGKNRRSGRDEARGNLAGGLGGDEDYDWIRYLGDGRSSSPSASSGPSAPPAPPSPAQTVARPAARSAPLPQRVRPERRAGRGRGAEAARAGREEGRSEFEARQPRSGDARPAWGPVTGRGTRVQPGRGTELLFNPRADDYSQPLYPSADDSQRRAMPSQDWQRERQQGDRPAPRRGERPPQGRLDTAEFKRPLYPADVDAAPAAGARRSRSRTEDDPLADTDTGSQRLPAVLWAASPDRPEAAVRTGSSPVLPDRVDRTAQPARSKPARKPRQTSMPKAGKSRPRAGKGRPKASQARPRAGRRLTAKVMIVLGSAMVAALAVAGYVVFRPQASHVVSAPASLGSYVRQQADATANDLRHRIVATAGGAVKNVVAAVYQRTTGPGTKKGPQIVVFIGGNLAGGASADSLISAYMARLRGAFTTSAGRLGGQAACAPASNGGPAECAWADNDTFGVVVSAMLNSAGLADVMRQIRPGVEHVVR
jgi:hypothetical protein